MTSLKGSLSSILPEKFLVPGENLGEGLRRALGDRGLVLCGAVGLVLGATLTSRWIRNRKEKRRLTRLRKKKQQERKEALDQLQSQIIKSKMTAEEVDRITKLDITELLDQLKSRRLSATQVLTAYQTKALEVHRKTNCLVEPILEAQSWALELDGGDVKGPLHGLPVSIKDCVGIKGYDTTVGCSKFIGQTSEEDSVVVKLLRKRGAIPFVKTNIPQTMISWQSTNPIFGLTVNPHDKERTAGGSSGGEGALIASGGSICGIGSDVGGSIRIPSALCGIPGFKPTAQRISKQGGRALVSGKNIQSSWGPMGRSVDGLIALMRSLLVPDMYQLDPTIPVMPFREEVVSSKRRLRIGFSLLSGSFEAVPAMRRAVLEAKALLEAAGHQVVEWNPSLANLALLNISCLVADGFKELNQLLDCDEIDDAVGNLVKISSLPESFRRLLTFVLKPFRPDISKKIEVISGFRNVTGLWDAVKQIQHERSVVISSWQENQLDGFLCPVFGCPAISNAIHPLLSDSGIVTYCGPFNAMDFPAGSVPVTKVTPRDVDELDRYPSNGRPTKVHELLKQDMKGSVGLPLSVQIVTLPWQDELCLRIMSDLELAAKVSTAVSN